MRRYTETTTPYLLILKAMLSALQRGFLLFLFVIALGAGVKAQQNLFNITSGVITPKKEFFFQQQINIYDLNTYAAKSHFVWGLGRDWELGFNVVDMNLDFRRQNARNEAFRVNSTDPESNFYPNFMITAQKSWKLARHVRANLGTQTGFNLGGTAQQTNLLYNHYGLVKWYPKEHTTFIGGVYHANANYVGPGRVLAPNSSTGFILGFEYPITHTLLLMGDYISGVNSQSTAAIGFNWYVTPKFQLCLGGLVPSPGSQNKYGVVFEINILTYDEKDYEEDDAGHEPY